MKLMLQYITGDEIPQLNEGEALDLLQAAKFFQIPRLLALCEAQIKVRTPAQPRQRSGGWHGLDLVRRRRDGGHPRTLWTTRTCASCSRSPTSTVPTS